MALDHLLSPRLLSHYLPRPGLPIQDLTESVAHHRIAVDPLHMFKIILVTPMKSKQCTFISFSYSPYQINVFFGQWEKRFFEIPLEKYM